MPTLSELLDQAVGPITPQLGTPDVRLRVHRRRQRRSLTLAGLVVVGLAVGAAAWPHSDPAPHVRTSAGGRTPGTDFVLVADDGDGGLTLVDLEHRVVVRRSRPGASERTDQLTRAGDSLITGSSRVDALPLDGRPRRALGTRTAWVSAAEDGSVWLYDYDDTEPPIRARRVDTSGRVLDDLEVPGLPIRGVAGGLLVRNLDQQVVVVPESATYDSLRPRIVGTGRTRVLDTSGTLVAYCVGNPCTTVQVVDLGTGRDVTSVTPTRAGETIDVEGVRFSPNSLQLAVTMSSRIVVFWPAGPPGLIADIPRRWNQVRIAWASDHELYLSGESFGQEATPLLHHDLTTGRTDEVSLPFGGMRSIIAVERADVAALLDVTPGPADRCRPPTIESSGSQVPCSFRF